MLESLIERSTFFDLPVRLVSGLPDVIQYRVRIEDAGRVHEITFDDEHATELLRSLVVQVLETDESD